MKDKDKSNYTPAAQFSEGCQWSSWEGVRDETNTWLFEKDTDSAAFGILVKLRRASFQEDGIQQGDLEGLLELMSRRYIIYTLVTTLLRDPCSPWRLSIYC